MSAVTCSAVHVAGVVASARATVASRGVAAAAPRVSANKGVFMAGSVAGRRGLALTAARGRQSAGARGFEVVAQAISEVRAG